MEDPLLQLISKKDWEFLKTRSKYHFKSDIIDPEFDTIGNIGKIIPTWTEKDLEMIATQSLSRMGDGDHSDYDMGKDGYDSNHVNISVSEKLPPFLKQIEHSFGLIQSTAWGYARPSKIVVQRPGQLWPLHMDLRALCNSFNRLETRSILGLWKLQSLTLEIWRCYNI